MGDGVSRTAGQGVARRDPCDGGAMGLTGAALAAGGMVFVASLPFAMAWVEQALMTGPTTTEKSPE